MDIKKLSLPQLHAANDSIERFMFAESHLFLKGEPFADSYKQDPKHFKAILSLMVSYKRDLMAYFNAQSVNMYNLVRQGVIQNAEVLTEDDMYFYAAEWQKEDDRLTALIEKSNKLAYQLGVEAILLLALLRFRPGKSDGAIDETSKTTKKPTSPGSSSSAGTGDVHSADDPDAQAYLTKTARKVAIDVNSVTRKRVKAQIKAAIELKEDRAAFEKRLKKVFVNPYRGRFIAQDQALDAYGKAKETTAIKSKAFTQKTWVGVQLDKQEICGMVIGETVPIDKNFSNGLPRAKAHIGCKCDTVYS